MASSTTGPLSLRDRHIGSLNSIALLHSTSFLSLATLKQMLNLNASPSYALKSSAVDLAWKVLIYDELGQDIISPLLTVKELRDLGVTLHVSVNQRIAHFSLELFSSSVR
jgi:hypothetical protein